MLDRRGIESYEDDNKCQGAAAAFAAAFATEAQIKQEPRDVGRSPRQKMSPHYQDFRVNPQPWNMSPELAGPSTFQLYQQLPAMHQVGLELQSLSMDPSPPNMQAASPLMHVPAQSPHMHSPHMSPSPHYQSPSPHMHVASPHMQVLSSPHYRAPSPNVQVPSPNVQDSSPHMQMLPTLSGERTLITTGVMQQPMQQQQQLGQLPQVPQGPPVSLDNIPSADISLTSLLGFLGADADIGDGHQPLHQ